MGKLKWLAVFVLIVASSRVQASTMARTASKGEFGAFVGCDEIVSPSGMTDKNSMGFGGGVFARWPVARNVLLGLSVSYDSFSGKDDGNGLEYVEYPTISTLIFMPQAKLKMNIGMETAKLYLTGGAGLCLLHQGSGLYSYETIVEQYTLVTPAVNETDFVIQPGVGLEFGSKITFFIEGNLRVVATSGDTFVTLPCYAGIKF